MSESAYIHFLSATFLSVLSIYIILNNQKPQKICKCVTCQEGRKLFCLKSKFHFTSKFGLKHQLTEFFKQKKILFLTGGLIIFSLYSLSKSERLFDGLPAAYKTLDLDIEATLKDIESAHRQKLMSIRKFKGKENYKALQTEIADAYNLLKLKVKNPNKTKKTEDLKTLKDVPSSHFLIFLYLSGIIFFFFKSLSGKKQRSNNNKYGINLNLVSQIVKSKVLEDPKAINKQGTINFIAECVNKIVIKDIQINPFDIDEIDTNLFLKNDTVRKDIPNKLSKTILKRCFDKLEASFYNKHGKKLSFASLCIYMQVYRSNILEDTLNNLEEEGMISYREKDQIYMLRDKIIFTTFQLIQTLKKLCVSVQILFCILRLQTDLLKGSVFSRSLLEVDVNQAILQMKKIEKVKPDPKKMENFDKFKALFSPPITVYSSLTHSRNTIKEPQILTALEPHDSHTIVRLKKRDKEFNKEFLQKTNFKNTDDLVHDPFLFPVKYSGNFDTCSPLNLALSPVSRFKSLYESNRNSMYNLFDKSKFYLPKKTYTLILSTRNTVSCVQNIPDFVGQQDIILENRGKSCLLYCDFTGLITEIQ